MDMCSLASVMQKSVIHKASASVGWRVVAIVGYIVQNPMGYQIHRGICTVSHSSSLLMKMGYKIRELECIDMFLSMETTNQYYRT